MDLKTVGAASVFQLIIAVNNG